jgi:long-chain fatty acid transport protein
MRGVHFILNRPGGLLGFFLPFVIASNSWAVGASGLTTQLLGAKALGQGNAFVAQADDPSAIYYNPAGLTQLSGTQVSVGTVLLVPITDRSGNGVPDDQAKRQLDALPLLYMTHAIPLAEDRKLVYGLGLNSPFGLVTDWAPTSSIRYVNTYSAFQLIELNPTVAVQVNRVLSIGVGADYVNLFDSTADSQVNQNALVPGAADGSSHLSGHGQGWGYNAGILLKPVENHSFAVSYRSQIQIPIRGSLELSGLDPSLQGAFNFAGANYSADATSSFILPQSVIGGYAYNPNKAWTLLLDYEWTQWNVFQDQRVAVQETDPNRLGLITGNSNTNVVVTPRHWHNVSAVGGGANYKWNDSWQFRGGYAFFEKTVPNDTFTPDVPDASVHFITLGLSRTWERFILDFAFDAFIYTNRDVSNTVGQASGASINGTYKTFSPAAILSLTYKIGP